MRTWAGLVLLTVAGCDYVPILDDLNDAAAPEHEVAAETVGPWLSGGKASVSVRLAEPGSDRPLDGRVKIELDGRPLAAGRTGGAGHLELLVPVPPAEGSRVLTVWSRTRFNTRVDSFMVDVKPGEELFFALDRPLAQPGQEVHLRALAFRGDRAADAGREVEFEVHDPSSNRVFREVAKASGFGVAHATFKLADEVALGDYRASAKAGSIRVEKPFSVRRYALPRFRIDLVAENSFAIPGEAVRGSVRARYVFGNPVAGAKVALLAEAWDGRAREAARLSLSADADGRADFEFDLPGGGTLLRIAAEVTDGAGHTESVAQVIPIVRAPLLVKAVPVSGRIVPGLENELAVFVTSGDGSPARAEVSAGGGFVPTDDLGVARLAVRESRVTLRARDGAGRAAEETFHLPEGSFLLLHPGRRAPRVGTEVAVEVRSARDGRFAVRLRTPREGTVAQGEAVVTGGRGAASIPLPAGLDGLAAVECEDASVLLWVRGSRRLEVRVRPLAPEVKPGEDMAVRFEVRDAEGRPARAALGVSVLDEALRGLAEIDPGAEVAAFALGGLATGPAARALWGEGDDARCEAAAALLLAGRSLEGKVARFSSRRDR